MRKPSRLLNNKREIGIRIRDIRELKGKSQEELAEFLEISTRQVGKIERGEALATLDTIVYCTIYFEVPMDYFLQDVKDMPAVSYDYVKKMWEKQLSRGKERLEMYFAEMLAKIPKEDTKGIVE